MKSFLFALKFLTIFPIPDHLCGNKKNLSKSIIYFPIVGMFLGLLLVLIAKLLLNFFPIKVTSTLIVMFLFVFSKGLHLDGLSDTFDALFSSKTKEQMLLIMKDKNAGPMGVASIIFIIMLKITFLSNVQDENFYKAIFLMPFYGRSGIIYIMYSLPYLRNKSGLGFIFLKNFTPKTWYFTFFLLIFTTIILLNIKAFFVILFYLIFLILFKKFLENKIQGYTGDTLGAVSEIGEVIPLLILNY